MLDNKQIESAGNGSESSRIALEKRRIDEGTELLKYRFDKLVELFKHLFEELGELYEYAERLAIRTAIFIVALIFIVTYVRSKLH